MCCHLAVYQLHSRSSRDFFEGGGGDLQQPRYIIMMNPYLRPRQECGTTKNICNLDGLHI